jgi:nucleoid-associated protein YgaU
VALGATVATSALGAPSAAFADNPSPAAQSYDWPGLPVEPGPAPTFDWPSSGPTPTPVRTVPSRALPPPAVPSRVTPVAVPTAVVSPRHEFRPRPTRAQRPVARPGAVVVAPGDSLWAIAARHLGPAASDAQLARAWPRWWHANRAAVGDDPNLIHPGTRLVPPSQR